MSQKEGKSFFSLFAAPKDEEAFSSQFIKFVDESFFSSNFRLALSISAIFVYDVSAVFDEKTVIRELMHTDNSQ